MGRSKPMTQLLFAPGVRGCIAGVGIFVLLYAVVCKLIKPLPNGYTFEPQGRPGSFELILARYSKLAEFVIGLATSSIVLLAGSSVFRSAGKLPPAYGSPLLLLAFSVIWGVLWLAWTNYNYEAWQHNEKYSHHRYRASVAFAFSGLLCFAVGYAWLGFALVAN